MGHIHMDVDLRSVSFSRSEFWSGSNQIQMRRSKSTRIETINTYTSNVNVVWIRTNDHMNKRREYYLVDPINSYLVWAELFYFLFLLVPYWWGTMLMIMMIQFKIITRTKLLRRATRHPNSKSCLILYQMGPSLKVCFWPGKSLWIVNEVKIQSIRSKSMSKSVL